MTLDAAGAVKAAIVSHLEPALRAARMSPADVPDTLDLVADAIVDSLGFLQLLAELERQFGVALTFEDLDPDQLTVVGPLSRYIADKAFQKQDLQ